MNEEKEEQWRRERVLHLRKRKAKNKRKSRQVFYERQMMGIGTMGPCHIPANYVRCSTSSAKG